MSATPSHAELLRHLHQKFQVWPDLIAPLEIELTHIRTQAAHQATDPCSPAFTLIFSSPKANPYLPQQVYLVERAGLGQVRLQFLPIGQDSLSIRYEATPA